MRPTIVRIPAVQRTRLALHLIKSVFAHKQQTWSQLKCLSYCARDHTAEENESETRYLHKYVEVSVFCVFAMRNNLLEVFCRFGSEDVRMVLIGKR